VQQSWTGDQVIWPMARGYEGQFGHILNAPYVWIPLALIFFFGLFDFRRVRRLAHLDLLFLLSFGISQVYFSTAEIRVSAPIAYIPLVYLFARMVSIGFRGGGTGLRPSVPITWLLVAVVFLCGFRIAVNIADSGVIDVGYAGVIGADRITQGEPIYGDTAFPAENARGDTYGPINYAAYIPFELAFPWSGEWDELWSAHAATIFFDLAAILGLYFLGRQIRPGRQGRDLGIVLAFAWTAYPYTALRDAVEFERLAGRRPDHLGLVAFSSLGWRAILLALAAGAKFTPLFPGAVVRHRLRGLAGRFSSAKRPEARMVAGPAPHHGSRRFVYRARRCCDSSTSGRRSRRSAPCCWSTRRSIRAWPRPGSGRSSQLDRTSPFSIWGQLTWLQPLQSLLLVASVGFAAALAYSRAGGRSSGLSAVRGGDHRHRANPGALVLHLHPLVLRDVDGRDRAAAGR
jgi:hypothetical protein